MELPTRKPIRLPDYDYSLPNIYFLTICTDKRRNIFWENVGAAIRRPEDITLSAFGKIVHDVISNITDHYSAIRVDYYVIMPDHVHILLRIAADDSGRRIAAPTISTVVNQMKGAASRAAGFSLWQKGYYDHIVRSDEDYREIWNYISGNPMQWAEDRISGGKNGYPFK